MTTENQIRVAVVIVNYNGGEYIIQCLEALEQQEQQPDKLIVVDNNSKDGSCEQINEQFVSVDLLPLARNTGFAAGNNRAFRELKGYQWVVLLNPDTVPEPGWLKALVDAINNNPDYQIFSSLLLVAPDDSRIDGSGDIYHVSGLGWRRHHGLSADRKDLSQDPVFTGCAAATAYRREDLEAVGGFDEAFFCYYEDIDLGFRLRLRGAKCMVVEASRVSHVGSGLTGRDSDFSIYHGHRNLVWTYFKNMPTGMLLWYLPQHLLLNLVTLLHYSFSGRARVIWKSKIHALRGLPRALSKRRAIQASRTISNKVLKESMVRGFLRPYFGRFR